MSLLVWWSSSSCSLALLLVKTPLEALLIYWTSLLPFLIFDHTSCSYFSLCGLLLVCDPITSWPYQCPTYSSWWSHLICTDHFDWKPKFSNLLFNMISILIFFFQYPSRSLCTLSMLKSIQLKINKKNPEGCLTQLICIPGLWRLLLWFLPSHCLRIEASCTWNFACC